MTTTRDLEPRFNFGRFLLSGDGWPYLLVPFIPLAIILELVGAGANRDLFNPAHDAAAHGGPGWSVRRAVVMLAVAGVAVGVMSEILVGSITETTYAVLALIFYFVT
jgi:Ca2+/H+ antiporter